MTQRQRRVYDLRHFCAGAKVAQNRRSLCSWAPRSVERLRLQPFAAGQLHASGQGHVRVGLRVATANPGLKDNKHTLLDERVPEELKLLVQLTLGKMLGERSRI